MNPAFPPRLSATAERNLKDILLHAVCHSGGRAAVVVYDSGCALAVLLSRAYRACLPEARFVAFDETSPDAVLEALKPLEAGDLVVLVQSTSFRLEAFRLRVDLFVRGLKVIEHPHLTGMEGAEAEAYVDSLAYEPGYYRGVGNALKARIDRASRGVVESGGESLVFESGFESAKLNVGDYSEMKNVGGQFPIGEVFTEARNLEAVSGRVRIFAFGDSAFQVKVPAEPITLAIEKGRVTAAEGSTAEFEAVLAAIRADETEVWVRELGFGLNRAFTRNRTVRAIGAYERMCGVHLSLGAKHAIYKKPAFTRSQARHHVDVFAITESVLLDGDVVYADGAWRA